MKSTIYKIWRLKNKSEKRFFSGHPWVFSNELESSPKGIHPGELIELRDSKDNFIATGYGNASSLIAFRNLSTKQNEIIDEEFFLSRFKRSLELRRQSGFLNASHRLVFAEGDYLPGLIIDRYLLADKISQVFVIQSSTAGMDLLIGLVVAALERLVNFENESTLSSIIWENTGVILANTSKSRVLENIPVEKKQIVKPLPEAQNLNNVTILIQSAFDSKRTIPFLVDLINGQKTGFFLDQRMNVQALISKLVILNKKSLRILDLCSYVGQWSSQIAHFAKEAGIDCECVLLDASSEALNFAKKNVEQFGARTQIHRGDVLKDISSLPDKQFDVVICDPPAFIKKKKDIPTGIQAYYKLNRESRNKVKDGGLFLTCSCSGLLTLDDFKQNLARISYNRNLNIVWIYQGFHSPDHPQRLEFPEGLYLKALMGVVNYN